MRTIMLRFASLSILSRSAVDDDAMMRRVSEPTVSSSASLLSKNASTVLCICCICCICFVLLSTSLGTHLLAHLVDPRLHLVVRRHAVSERVDPRLDVADRLERERC